MTAIIQFAACAQAKPASDAAQTVETNQPAQAVNQTVAAQTAIDKTTAATLVENFDFTALNNEMLCSPEVLLESFTVTPQYMTPKQPKVQAAVAKSNLVAQPPVQKLHEVNFAEPEKDSKHAPKTFHASAYAIQGRTRSGAKTEKGVVAADPRVLPLGTVVQMSAGKYTGVYTVHDIGGAIKGNRVDVWVPSVKEARRFGRRNVKLVVLRYPGQNKPVAQK
ncbi:MAG: 3D domain-containing protein [Acidobacteria bacterium]|nr:3D domain-containing protein [Acidobacteriota bacterium]MBI3421862.1 3D domain-containing protein [Acidobacteriota bacterium]